MGPSKSLLLGRRSVGSGGKGAHGHPRGRTPVLLHSQVWAFIFFMEDPGPLGKVLSAFRDERDVGRTDGCRLTTTLK